MAGILNFEIDKIINSKNPKTNNIEYSFSLHTADADVAVTIINSYEVYRDYNGSSGDIIFADFVLGTGDYVKDVHPNRNNLMLTIKEKNKFTNETKSSKYKFVITNNDENMNASKYAKLSKEFLNSTEQTRVVGQCILKEVEAGRVLYADGVFRSTTMKNLLISEFVNNLKKIKTEGQPVNVDCSVVEPNNTNTYNHIVIPTGIKLFDLPTYLQNGEYGIYNGSIGCYIQAINNKPTVFVYPLYDKDRYEKTDKKLTIYHSNSTKYTFVENTYVKDGDILKVLATNDIHNIDSGENDFMDTGASIISSNPNMLTKRNVKADDNKISTAKDSQLKGSAFKKRDDGMANPVYVGNESNLFKYRADIVKKSFTVYQIPWKFPDMDLIYPGMPVCFTYEDESEGVIKLYGQVQNTYSRYTNLNKTTVGVIVISVMKPSVYL